jgi:hypothetical protein
MHAAISPAPRACLWHRHSDACVQAAYVVPYKHALPWCLSQLARLEAIKWCVVVAVVLCCVDTIGRSDIPAVAYCSWSFCNYAAASLGYPTFTTRMADCPGQVRASRGMPVVGVCGHLGFLRAVAPLGCLLWSLVVAFLFVVWLSRFVAVCVCVLPHRKPQGPAPTPNTHAACPLGCGR